jgi:hypothetical protein
VVATWSGLVSDRLHFGGLVKHVVTYPLETFACLLPWSPLLVALMKRETRALLSDARPITTFLFVALLIAYPTVWLAAGARGRYFMPMYPLVAVLIGLVIERCSTACSGGYPRHAWHQFLLLSSVLIGAGGAVIGASGLVPGELAGWLYQPRWFSIAFGLLAMSAVWMLWKCYRVPARFAPISAVITVALFVGIAYSGIMINVNAARWNDLSQDVAELKKHLPQGEALVSFAPIEHRFEYYYGAPIAQLEWPRELGDLPSGVEYFCFMRYPGDTAERRTAGRGWNWTTTPGTLPFAWEEIISVCIDRSIPKEKRMVVLGRVLRPLRAVVSDATRPQRVTVVAGLPTESRE